MTPKQTLQFREWLINNLMIPQNKVERIVDNIERYFSSPAQSGQVMKDSVKLAIIDNLNLYRDSVGCDRIPAKGFSTIANEAANEIMKIIESPSTPSGEAEGVPVSEYAKVLSLLESSFKQNAQPAKGFFTEDELNNGWRRYKAINEISESAPVQEGEAVGMNNWLKVKELMIASMDDPRMTPEDWANICMSQFKLQRK